MSHVAVDKDGTEGISDIKPVRDTEKYADAEHPEVMIGNSWVLDDGMDENMVEMPKGSIKKLIGKELTWNDEPVELK